jgi:hypothetical protein
MMDDNGYHPVLIFLYMWGGAIVASPDFQMDMQLAANDAARGDVFGATAGLVGIMLPGVPSSVVKGGGKLVFKTGYAAEKYLRKLVGGDSLTMWTNIGQGRVRRVIDVFVDGVAHESKVGYTSLSGFIRKEVLKDGQLLKDKDVKQVVWHFYRSGITGKKGPSKPLADFLINNGITYIIH